MTAATALGGRLGSINVEARRRRRIAIALLVAPALLVVAGALLVPAVNLLVQSFMESSGYGGVAYHFTFSNYADALRDPTYRTVAWHSFGLGALAGLVCVVAAYPAAYFISFKLRRGRNIALFLVVISLFTSYLVRLYAWYTILGSNGIVNTALIHVGVVSQPLQFLLFSRTAVLIAFAIVIAYKAFSRDMPPRTAMPADRKNQRESIMLSSV